MASVIEIEGQLKLDTTDFDSKIDAAEAKAKGFTDAASGAGGTGGTDAIVGSADNAASSLSASAEAMEHLTVAARGESLMQVADTIDQWTSSLDQFSSMAVDAASDLNESTSAVTQVYGESADAVLQFAEGSAQNLGITEQAALDSAAQLGAMFTAMGMSTEESANMSNQLQQTAADLGSFHNAMPIEVLGALRAGLTGEAEPLKRFGILMNADAVEAKALEMGLAATSDELTEGMKVQARAALIMGQLGERQGDFARTSEGLANATRIQQAEMANLRAEMGVHLLPIQLEMMNMQNKLLGVFGSLNPEIQKYAAIAAFAAGNMGPLVRTFGQLLLIGPQLMSVFGALMGPLGLLVLAIAAVGIAYQTNFLGFADLINGTVLPALQQLASFMQNVLSIFQSEGAGAGFAALFDPIIERVPILSGIISALTPIFDEVGSTISLLTGLFVGLVQAGVNPLEAAFTSLSTVFPALSGAFAVAQAIILNFIDTLKGIGAGLSEAIAALQAGDIAGVLNGIFNAAYAAVNGFIAGLVIIGEGLLQAFTSIDWQAVSDGVASGLQTASTALQTWLDETSEKLLTSFQTAWDQLAPVVTEKMALVLDAANAKWGEIATATGEKWEEIKTTVNTKVSELADSVSTKFEEVRTAVETKWEEVRAATETKWEEVRALVETKGTEIVTSVTAKFEEVKTAVSTKMGEVFAFLQTNWQQIADMVTGKAEEIRISVELKFDELKTAVSTKMGEVQSDLQTKWEEIKSNIETKVEEVRSSVESKFEEVRASIETKTEEARAMVETKFGEMVTAATTKLGEIVTEVTAKFEEIRVAVETKGNEIKEGFITALETMATEASAAVSGIRESVIAAFAGARDWLLQAGKDIIGGLVDGIMSMAGAVQGAVDAVVPDSIGAPTLDWAQPLSSAITGSTNAAIPAAMQGGENLGDGVQAGARGSLRTGSPSKAMWEIGQDAAAGLVLGLMDGIPMLSDVNGEYARALTDLESKLLYESALMGKGFVQLIEQVLTTGAQLVMTETGQIVDQYGNVLVDNFTTTANAVKEIATDMTDGVLGASADILTGIQNDVEAAMLALKKTETSIGGIEPGDRESKDRSYERELRRIEEGERTRTDEERAARKAQRMERDERRASRGGDTYNVSLRDERDLERWVRQKERGSRTATGRRRS